MITLLQLFNSRITLILGFASFFLSFVVAVTVNATIDDTFGDSMTGQQVNYLPATNAWDNQDCSPQHCTLLPDVSQAFEATYKAATYVTNRGPRSITMHFVGTAIYIFFILGPGKNTGTSVTFTAANFTLDKTPPYLFTYAPNATNQNFLYHQLVFHQEKLDNTVNHTLTITASGLNSSYVNFDYAIYTFEKEALPTPSPPMPKETESESATVTDTKSLNTSILDPESSTSTKIVTSTSSQLPSPAISSTNINVPATSPSDIEQSGENSKSSVSTGVIVGGVIGGLAVLALTIVVVYFLRYDSRHQRRLRGLFPSAHAPPPY